MNKKLKMNVIEKLFNMNIKQIEKNQVINYIFKIDKSYEFFMLKEFKDMLNKFKNESKIKYIYYYLNKFEYEEFVKNVDNYLLNMIIVEMYLEFIFSIIFTKNKKDFEKNYKLAINYCKDFDTEMLLKTSDIYVYYNKIIQNNLNLKQKLRKIKNLSFQRFFHNNKNAIDINLIYEMLNKNFISEIN